MIYQIHFGWFLFEINILNLPQNSEDYSHTSRLKIGQGSFGAVSVG